MSIGRFLCMMTRPVLRRQRNSRFDVMMFGDICAENSLKGCTALDRGPPNPLPEKLPNAEPYPEYRFSEGDKLKRWSAVIGFVGGVLDAT